MAGISRGSCVMSGVQISASVVILPSPSPKGTLSYSKPISLLIMGTDYSLSLAKCKLSNGLT